MLNKIFIILLITLPVHAETERDYQESWCYQNNGRTEVVLSDRTRVDCLTETHAIEFDFGKKWSEAIGQSLGYAIETGKTPGIVLIIESKKDYRFYIKLNSIINYYGLPIDTWLINPVILRSFQQH